jgi:hypothetical protein
MKDENSLKALARGARTGGPDAFSIGSWDAPEVSNADRNPCLCRAILCDGGDSCLDALGFGRSHRRCRLLHHCMGLQLVWRLKSRMLARKPEPIRFCFRRSRAYVELRGETAAWSRGAKNCPCSRIFRRAAGLPPRRYGPQRARLIRVARDRRSQLCVRC